jgi:cyclic beta-1,2-glucan synthetase
MFIWYSTVFALMMIIAIYIILKGRNHRNKYTVLESRDALLSPEELERHAAEIAKKHNISKNNGFSDCLITRMNRNFNLIASVYKMLNKDVKMGIPVSPAAEWLLDNFYIVEEQVKGIRNDLVREKCLQLNILNSGFLKGYPRVYAIALELVSHLDGRLDKSIILNFIKIYQSQNILSMGELWAMPMMLKIALIENMTNLCEKIGQTQIQIKNVRNFSHMDLSAIDNLIKENLKIIDRGSFSFIEQLLKKLRQAGRETKEILNHLDKKLFEFDLTADKIIQEEHQEQASRQVAMGNSVTSLKMMASLNWNKLFEELSVVEGILREDPDGSYPRMDFESRNYYRNQIEKMAQQLKTSEINVARKALKLALEAGSAQTKFRHVGYYLVGLGKNKLIQELGGRGNQRAGSMNRYLGPVCIITSLIIVLCIVYAIYAAPESKASVLILVALVALIPASDIAVTIVNRIITSRTEPTFLPKIAYNEGIPKEAATLVVVPTLLPHTQRVQELIRQLEVHYLGNREDNIYFALLGDFKDADRQQLPGDEEIMLTARKAIEELNKKYAGDKDVFFFFSRNRTFSQQQNCWMGWERKRGALLELNNLLENPEKKGSFNIVGDISVLNQIKYVITLDADTRLPLHGAKKLIGTISHPLNKAVFDHKKGIVVEGYGLIQPRINVSIESANKTLFTRIFAGQGGIDPYTTAISDVYQDYFGEGIFTGKGIYDLEVFQKTLKDAIPENTILSHDLLEGSYVRVGLATDLELVDGYPAKYNSYMMRLHRWVRGDWQLIHWLSSFIKNQKGDRIPNPISSLSRWKILDNLRRSLVSFSVMLLFILGSTIFPGHSLFWLGFGLITIGFPFILECSDFVLRKHYRTEWDKRHSNIIFGLKGVFYQVFLVLVFLPYQAYMMTDAIIRSLYRMIVTRKNLLQWVTAADVEKKIKSNLFSFIRQMAPAVFGAIAIFLLVFFMRRESLFYLFPLLILWCVSPLAAYYISRDNVDKKDALSQNDINELRKLARKTWAYYEDFAGAKDNFLPPDNFQENPPNGVAHRTSPTNIGFLFMAILAARDFGFICTTQLSEMVERTLTTVEKMDKWKGHLYNWYHTLTLKVLKPAFVSTVDSGNFVGYLMTLKQGLREYLKRPLVDRYLLQGMKSTLELAGKEYPQAFKSIEDLLGKNQIGLYDWCCFLDTISLEKPVKSNWLQRFERMLESYQREMQSLFLPLNFFQELPEILDEAERYRIVLELVQSLQENCSIGDLKEIYAKLIKEAEKALLNSTGEEQKKILSQLIIEIKRVKKNVVLICDRFEDLIFRLEKLIEGTCFCPSL